MLLLFCVAILYLLIIHGYLTPDFMVMEAMMILTIFFSYVYYLMAFTKDEKGSDFKKLLLSSLLFVPCILLAIYMITKVFICYY
ncbi:hypothetical protein CD131_08395 [Staphylococcus muscae]|nr:hypothetical protein CD131_08395 [Staphylococcus muscae]